MTEQQKNADEVLFGRAGLPSFKFSTVGTEIVGSLVSKDTQQATEWNPADPSDKSKLKFFPKTGEPIMELILTLQTDLRDPAIEHDNGLRRVFVSYPMQQVLQRAVMDAGIKRTLPLDSRIHIKLVSWAGGNARKEFAVVVTPPVDALAVGIQQPVARPVAVTVQTAPQGGYSAEMLELAKASGITLPGM